MPFAMQPGIWSGVLDSHDAIRAVIKRTSLLNTLFTQMDSMFGYDKIVPAKNFWDSH
jgi:hypothetical protein